ncbi:Putative uncharacterized protein [Taphrina deformans PYCC 5710]|uniref:DUF676 domain-containing protein n=1 Tax=Taphrina deformans (strain PYCC 5710 / ATCC 11124 / CBS 356.35 / IMI 108563 / JCM 9778 / NBRC 8474) TaxID=1097556 RepID=R4X6E9_TAPDE|nr:Putative uncharacterized protein [Taphrina deformans PYCC 5710]|eukprot:CCG80659.1 Putative uncharacterized protein [Taphrina deformans PYCC 5710]
MIASKKTILLVFIHGFKGGSDTFATFPDDLEKALKEKEGTSDVEFRALVYPPYDTKGNFRLAVSKLRDWLQNTVIDIESQRGTSSPTINSTVKIVLLGHSMGGLVAADVIIELNDEFAPAMLFPNIIGLFALDSPMLGLAPSLWTNGADGLFQKGKSLYDNAASLSAIGSGLFASKVVENERKQKAIEPKSSTGTSFGWKSIAAISAAGAFAAGSALYSQKDKIGRGLSWITDHLEFIGTLRRTEELSERTVKVNSIENVKFSCYYTRLTSKSVIDGGPRTFIVLPKGELLKSRFHPQENARATDEVGSHTSMFVRDKNSGYDEMLRAIFEETSQWVNEAMAMVRMNPEQT